MPRQEAAREIEMEDREIRAALERPWAASDANDFVVEHEIYREDAVLHYPQSGERIRGRCKIQESRTVQPSEKRFSVSGSSATAPFGSPNWCSAMTACRLTR